MSIRIGRERLAHPGLADRLEWLVTNGIGGFASGTLGGALARRYHGLLVAALKPPLGRTLMAAKLAESVEIDGERHVLDHDHWADAPAGPSVPTRLESFHIEESVPVWTWAFGDTRLEKRIWMEQGENTTYVQYRLAAGRRPVALALRLLANHRDMHASSPDARWQPRHEATAAGLGVEVAEGATPLWLFAPGAEMRPAAEPYRRFRLPFETERGLDDVEDHLAVADIDARLEADAAFTLILSTRADAGVKGRGLLSLSTVLARRRAHDKSVLDAWRAGSPAAARTAPGWVRQLVLAADQFVVERRMGGEAGRSVIAGYPWFADWGRDTMIALPGLTLATGRPEIARRILSTFLRLVDGGMLPNTFPEDGEAPMYNTVDATLWLFQALSAYVEETGDEAFLREVYPALEGILDAHERGTRHGIAVDPADGLLRQGEPGVALTWMDAKVEDWVVTPRHGKPVEVNALWYSALLSMDRFARRLGRPEGRWAAMAARVETAFERFWDAETGGLFDVLDGPEGADRSIRPNQLFAVSLPDSPLTPARQRAVVELVGRRLLTSHGLRSLAPGHPDYHGRFTGDRRQRDGAYHQGTVWTWLLPHYALAHFRVYHDREGALALLEPFADLLTASAVGTLPEVADGDPPFGPRGCFAQAWTVAETLRAWHRIAVPKRRAAIRTRRAPAVAPAATRRPRLTRVR